MSAVPVIGLVGGIGSGKSSVAGILRELGCVISDSDEVAHECLREPSVVSLLVDRWGDRVLAVDGGPDRSVIARIVFADESSSTSSLRPERPASRPAVAAVATRSARVARVLARGLRGRRADGARGGGGGGRRRRVGDGGCV